MVVPTRAEILAKAADGTLLDAIFTDYGRHWVKDDDPTVIELAEIHNKGEVDLLALVTPESLEPFKGATFFAGQHIYQALICKINASAEALVRVVDALIEAGGSDMAASFPANEFAKWCAAHPARPAELLDVIDRKVLNSSRYLSIAIMTGVDIDPQYFAGRAYDFLVEGESMEKLAAINALGQIRITKEAEWDRWVAAFSALLFPDPGDAIRAAIVSAAARRLKDVPDAHTESVADIAIMAIEPLGDSLLSQCAYILGHHFEELSQKLKETLLAALVMINPIHRGTVDSLDFALTKFIEAGDPLRAQSFLENLFDRTELTLADFDSMRYKLLEVKGEILDDWIVRWLRIGNFKFCRQIDEMLLGAGTENLIFTIDFSRFGLSDKECVYIARKAIGTFFLKPFVMTSILISLVRSASTAATVDLEDLLLNPILMNYSGIDHEYIRIIAADPLDLAGPIATRALERLATYIDGLKSIGRVKELYPSERERQLEWQRHSDKMSKAFREARKKSIFASIMSESIILHGTGSVSWVQDPSQVPRRLETQLSRIENSMELPRVDIVDPLGLELMLLRFRTEKPLA